MTRRTMRWVAAVSLLAAGAAAGAQAGGGAAGAWLGLGGGARAAAMANAMAAVADDASALFFNPAGLDQVPGTRVELTYHYPYSEFKDLAYANGALSYNMSGRGYSLGTVAAGVNYFKASGIPAADDMGPTGRTFSDYEMAFSLGWGKGLGGDVAAGEEPKYYLGLAAKVVSSRIYEYQDGGFGLDAGIMLHPLAPVRVGLAFDDIVAPNIEFIETGDVYPATARVGASYAFTPAILAVAEGRVRKDGDAGVAFAGEVKVAKVLALRAGYRYPEARPAAGAGVAVGKYGFDFCWKPGGDLGSSLVATAAVAW